MNRFIIPYSSILILISLLSYSQTTFNKYAANPVFSPSTDDWDSRAIGGNTILYKDSLYHMWYGGSGLESHPDDWKIGYATSGDGIHWTRSGEDPVLTAGSDGDWDAGSVGWFVVIFDSIFHMWYAGYKDLYKFNIGYATSDNGIDWIKHTANPVIKVGKTGSWENGFILPASVVKSGSTFHMWYIGATTVNTMKIGYASSLDGINWIKSPSNPLTTPNFNPVFADGKANCDVTKRNNLFHMYYYYGKSWLDFSDHDYSLEMRIGYATSVDGVNWDIHPDNPVLRSSYFNWDIPTIGEIINPPRVLYEDGVYKMWYRLNRQIGFASDELPEHIEKGAGGIFEKRFHDYGDDNIPYRLFVPSDYDSTYSYPLVVILHGSGQRGTDNKIQLLDPATGCFSYEENQDKYPCIIVAPQCPPDMSWIPLAGNMDKLIDSIITELSIDENRIYITGYSMGGYGTFHMLHTYPDRFAAALPLAGTPAGVYYFSDINHIPLWIFHGQKDLNVKVSNSRTVIKGFEQLGRQFVYTHANFRDPSTMPDSIVKEHIKSNSDYLYTEYVCEFHDINEIVYTNPDILHWMFSKYRRNQDAIRITNLREYRLLEGIDEIQWSSGYPEDSVEIWFRSEHGDYWSLVMESVPNSGSYSWNTEDFPDCSFGQIQLLLKDDSGNVFGKTTSRYFGINNALNGKPSVRILNQRFVRSSMFLHEEIDLQMLIGDPEGDTLDVDMLYSQDNGMTYSLFDSYRTAPDTASQYRLIKLHELGDSEQARVKVTVSDGTFAVSDSTYFFKNVQDTEPPTTPAGLAVSSISSTSITLNWTQSTDNKKVLGYKIYFDGALSDSTLNISYSAEGLEPGTSYEIAISAYDEAGNESPLSTSIIITTSSPDNESPTIPTGLEATNITANSFDLHWNPSMDNAGVEGYSVFLDDQPIAASAINEYSVYNLQSNTTYQISVSAFDEAGNESSRSNSIEVTTLDPSVGFITDTAENNSKILIYPNPTDKFLTLETRGSGPFNLKISSVNGQVLYNIEITRMMHQFDLSSFQIGIYFITIRSKDFVTIRKIIKM